MEEPVLSLCRLQPLGGGAASSCLLRGRSADTNPLLTGEGDGDRERVITGTRLLRQRLRALLRTSDCPGVPPPWDLLTSTILLARWSTLSSTGTEEEVGHPDPEEAAGVP